jgi:HlyD family secretion protein
MMSVGRIFIRAGTAVALASLVFLSACSKQEGETQPVVSVQAVPAKQGSISQVITADAVLFPIEQATIVPKVSAPVLKAYVKRGEKVHKWQLLLTLENRDLQAAAEQQRGNLEQQQAQYEIATKNAVPEEVQKAEGDAEAAKENLDAQQAIYNSRKSLLAQGAIARKDFDAASVALVQAKAQYQQAQQHLAGLQAVGKEQNLKAAKAQLTAAEGASRGADAQFGYSEIRSPIAGVVTDGPWYPGMMPAQGAPLVTVMNLSQMIAKVHIPQNQAALLKKGDAALISVPGGDEPIKGKVTLVSPALDPGSTTVEVWVQAPNPEGEMKAGESAIISVTAKTVPSALVVPAQAVVIDDDGKKSVMVIGDDSAAHKRDVQTGIETADAVQITNGLKPGEQIVSVGPYGLPDKTKVKVEAPPGPGKEGGDEKDKGDEGGN